MPSIRSVPSTPAPTHPGRFRASGPGNGVLGLGGLTGGPFLPDVFGGAARQVVKAAFGANLGDAPSSWVWTDITTPYVQWDPGVNIQIGPQGTASKRIVASVMTAVLRNDQPNGGDWTIGNQLGRWGSKLRENTPICAQVDVGNGLVDRFFGYLTSASPKRGPAGENWVALTAHGISRRIARGKSAPFSALRKSLDRALPTAYWSLEKGAGGNVGASAVAGVPDMRVTAGVVAFGTADDSLPSSLPLAQMTKDGTAGQLTGTVPTAPMVTGGRTWSFEFVMKSPTQQTGALVNIVDWFVTSMSGRTVQRSTPRCTSTATSRRATPHLPTPTASSRRYSSIRRWTATISTASASATSPCGTAPGPTPRTPTRVRGHTGETVAERMARLGLEAGVPIEIIGDADDLMGPQRAGPSSTCWQDAVDVDGGVLVDGLGPGYTYFTRQPPTAAPPALTLESRQRRLPHRARRRPQRHRTDQPSSPPRPVHQRVRTYEVTDGPLGTDEVGEYEDGDNYRVNIPDQLDQIAAWRAGQGTVPGLRWPQLRSSWPSRPRPLAQQWLDTGRCTASTRSASTPAPSPTGGCRWSARGASSGTASSSTVTVQVASYDGTP
jgi:hypothetical protein